MDDMREQHAAWCRSLQEAIQADAWGQVLEAVEAYESLAAVLDDALPRCYELSIDHKRMLQKTARSVELRAKSLSSVEGEHEAPSKDDMEQILAALRELLSTESPPVFPLDLSTTDAATRAAPKSSTVQVVEADDDHELLDYYAESAVTTKTPLRRPGSGSYLDIDIVRVGLKDAKVYVNPTIVVSVYDRDGTRLEEPKETPVGTCEELQHIAFRTAAVQLETSLQLMEEHGAVVIFEIYHYKQKKRKKSCRCWTLLEMDELTATKSSGKNPLTLALELYQKPMDPTRKRIHLFTVKELFLHLHVRIIST